MSLLTQGLCMLVTFNLQPTTAKVSYITACPSGHRWALFCWVWWVLLSGLALTTCPLMPCYTVSDSTNKCFWKRLVTRQVHPTRQLVICVKSLSAVMLGYFRWSVGYKWNSCVEIASGLNTPACHLVPSLNSWYGLISHQEVTRWHTNSIL